MNNNILTNTTELAMLLTKQYISNGDFVIDATCGNGHDTYSLSELVGKEGHVLAIDIQKEALEYTKANTCITCSNITYINDNFTNIDLHANNLNINHKPKAIIFNLGYLPGGNKNITTNIEDSIVAIEKSLELIDLGGIVTIVLYSGHPQGKIEKETILNWSENLSSSKYHAVYISMTNQKKNPPEILMITKKK